MKHQREHLAKEHEVKGEPSLHRVNSIDYANCAPWEWMHLFLENIIPQLVDLWQGVTRCWMLAFVHSQLHMCGPAWVHWTFYIERYCLHLRTGLHSRWHPWSGLSRVVLYTAYLSQLSVKFDLQDELKDLNHCCGQQELENEQSFENLHLPSVMPLWGKMQIIGGGDSIRTKYALMGMSNAKYCDNLFFEVLYSDAGESQPINVISYGRLDKILICELGEHKIYSFLRNTTLILALITPCNADGTDASISLVGYKEFVSPVVTDVRNIKAVVGRVQT
ncbi:uncharacterized protein EDB93DRAFT_1241095 [Suillus bovinus]|uniref:uncharacterized protein n=1 Tax=Suillus bovinus TaxID=48563 RepID=UPI001B868078|nr:uncharacterized protein EDB93DRAFT_1241095 [Suillus bovinus]KAG2146056.1 hypothetical protein EDB93DRAFT_1241095 [Suillus bovinus]